MSVRTSVPLCKLIVESRPLTGAENMAADERLLQSVVADSSTSYVRIYRWSEPTVSLGYFQAQDAGIDERLTNCPRVRRITGGGAILHDAELTYCCAIPDTHPVRSAPTQLYELVHSALIDLMGDCGADTLMRMHAGGIPEIPADKRSGAADETFLCFLRQDPRDVVWQQKHKILGSAQRRRRGSILQHGSILLSASSLTPELPGLLDLCPAFDLNRFEACVGETIKKALLSYEV